MNWSKTSSLVEVVEESMSAVSSYSYFRIYCHGFQLLTGVNAPSLGGAAAISSSANATINYANTAAPSPTGQTVNQFSTYNPTTTNPTYGMTVQQAQQYNQQKYGFQPSLPSSGPSALSINNPAFVPPGDVSSRNNVNTNSNSSSSSSSSNVNGSYGGNQALSANTVAGSKTPITMPDVPTVFPELEKLTDIQLERLLTDEIALQAALNKMSSVESIQQVCDQMRDSNNDRAARNLVLEGDITLLQKRATELQAELGSAVSKVRLICFVSVFVLIGYCSIKRGWQDSRNSTVQRQMFLLK